MSQFNHAEAYCLMRYQCKVCGETEILYNSRDGVTPFSISCKNGCPDGLGSPMSHIDFGADRCEPRYIPIPGMRVFIDMTREKSRELWGKKVAKYWADNTFNCHEQYGTQEKMVDALSAEFKEGSPDIITIN